MFFFISTIFFLSSFFFFFFHGSKKSTTQKIKKTKIKIFINFFFLLFMFFRFSCWQEKKSGKMRVGPTFPFCSSSGSCVSKKLLTIYDSFFFSLKEVEDGKDTVIRVFKAFPSASGLESPNEKKNMPFRVTLLFFCFIHSVRQMSLLSFKYRKPSKKNRPKREDTRIKIKKPRKSRGMRQ